MTTPKYYWFQEQLWFSVSWFEVFTKFMGCHLRSTVIFDLIDRFSSFLFSFLFESLFLDIMVPTNKINMYHCLRKLWISADPRRIANHDKIHITNYCFHVVYALFYYISIFESNRSSSSKVIDIFVFSLWFLSVAGHFGLHANFLVLW